MAAAATATFPRIAPRSGPERAGLSPGLLLGRPRGIRSPSPGFPEHSPGSREPSLFGRDPGRHRRIRRAMGRPERRGPRSGRIRLGRLLGAAPRSGRPRFRRLFAPFRGDPHPFAPSRRRPAKGRDRPGAFPLPRRGGRRSARISARGAAHQPAPRARRRSRIPRVRNPDAGRRRPPVRRPFGRRKDDDREAVGRPAGSHDPERRPDHRASRGG